MDFLKRAYFRYVPLIFFLIIQKTVSSYSKYVKNLSSPWLSFQLSDLLFFSEGDKNRIVVAKFSQNSFIFL